jgi:hypothetical protein
MEKNKDGQPVVLSKPPSWVSFAVFLFLCLAAGMLITRGAERIRDLGKGSEIPPTSAAVATPVNTPAAVLQGVASAQACEEMMMHEGSNSYYFGEYLNAGAPKYGCIVLLNGIWVER